MVSCPFAPRADGQLGDVSRIEWLKDYCAEDHFVYLDYFSAAADKRGMLKRALARDGLHPTDAGL